ncbi:hypothetical protein COCVIDRAFT_106957 [Bipolaris victoriae FI3]|uniref:Uncharacterized protein n=1 Tax=Bipolaris victoriae (strain FI3) TaxID=930091 RepID=W7EAN2_BIPV3|nr:hypothetical protein COCVIDRAFT_106957 [Bipolaris victoriae FI3]
MRNVLTTERIAVKRYSRCGDEHVMNVWRKPRDGQAAAQDDSTQMGLLRHPKVSTVNTLQCFRSCHDYRAYIPTTCHTL